MIYVIKRDGRKMPFNTEKIKQAILRAANNQSQYKINDATIASIQ